MFPLLLNPLPILITITTTFGVLLHDTHIDRAATAALALPVAIVAIGAIDKALKLNDPHTHTSRFVLATGSNPRTPARDDDKKYVSVKKYVSDGMGSQYHWPSA